MTAYKSFKENPMYIFLVMLCIASAVGNQGWQTLFNNFAVEEAGVDSVKMGIIQSLREVPGFLTFFSVYILLFIAEHRFASTSIVLLGLGVMLTGFFTSLGGLIFTTVLMSVGFHYFDTANQSLTLQYFQTDRVPLVLGKLRSITALSNIGVGVAIWLLSRYLSYQMLFLGVGLVVILIGVYSYILKPVDHLLPPQHKKLIFKRKYWLFYVLNFLAGARRQIFIVFAVFILVQKYHFSVIHITVLFVINNIITWLLSPYIGKAINRYGERKMLTVEYVSLVIVFMLYALIENRWAVSVLYIIDNLFFSFAIAINSFFRKKADPADIAPSMAVGFTINHITAVVLPVIGGILWMVNWRLPFIGGAILAMCSLIFSQFVKTEPALPTTTK
ncbi:MAG: MFS transporter [Bacteroidales bacterium]|nr:MFS transporter [Bacteroidales bacterium]